MREIFTLIFCLLLLQLSWGFENDTCALLTTLAHGTMDPIADVEYYQNDTVSFQCDDGYSLSGASEITCLGGDEWDDDQPICACQYNIYIYPNYVYS